LVIFQAKSHLGTENWFRTSTGTISLHISYLSWKFPTKKSGAKNVKFSKNGNISKFRYEKFSLKLKSSKMTRKTSEFTKNVKKKVVKKNVKNLTLKRIISNPNSCFNDFLAQVQILLLLLIYHSRHIFFEILFFVLKVTNNLKNIFDLFFFIFERIREILSVFLWIRSG